MSRGIKATIAFCLFVFIVVFGIYVYNFCYLKIENSQLQFWGQTGDYFGGVLNPFFALASFMAVLYSIHIQRIELRENRIQEVNLQNYNFAQDKLDYRLKIVEELVRRKFNLKIPMKSDAFISLMTFHVFACNHFSSDISTSDTAKKAHDKSIMPSRTAVSAAFNIDNGELKESVQNLLAEYTFEVSSLKILYESYSQIAKELKINVEADPIAKYLLSMTAAHLSYAYILNHVVVTGEDVRDLKQFVPDKTKNEILFHFFLGAMEVNKLPKSAIKYFHEVKKAD